MRKIYYLLVLLTIFTETFAQNNQSTQTSATTPINIGNTIIYDTTQSTTSTSSTLTAGTPTGDSQEVGVTEGELSVSLTGSASYNIPIAVPPGINGVEPKIGLSYNSNAGNGIAGYGWNISGLSAITRIPSTKYHDNNNDPVDFDASDRFALDGQRLIVKSGTSGVYGNHNTYYETENFSNLKIRSYGGNNYGPEYFVVQYPDGSLARYGNTSSSRSITTWAITYWENAQGIRINYFYTLLDNNLYIASIKYGNSGQSPSLNEISFVYKWRNRKEYIYIAGNIIQDKQIIEKINVIGNSEYIRNYFLEYQSSSLGYDKLIKLTQRAGNSSTIAYNPTVFEYENTSIENTLGNSQYTVIDQNVASSDYKYTVGDFDGDEKSDFIFCNKTSSNTYGTFTLYKGLDPLVNPNVGLQSSMGFYGEIVDVFASRLVKKNQNQELKILNEDCWTIVSRPYIPSYPIKFKSFKYNKNTNVIELVQERSMNNSGFQSNAYHFLTGDFNGDKISDVFVLVNNYDSILIDLNDDVINYNTNYQATSLPPIINDEFVDVQLCDFNGDGKSDFAVFDSTGIRVYTLNTANNSIMLVCSYNQPVLANRPHYVGDFNGDGNTDFVVPGESNSLDWTFYISNGLNNFSVFPSGVYMFNYPSENKVEYGGSFMQPDYNFEIYYTLETTYIVNDYNRDGKTDIVQLQRKKKDHTRVVSTGIEDYTGQGTIYDSKNSIRVNKGFIFFEQALNLGNGFVGGIGGLSIVTNINKSSVYNLDYSYVQGNGIFSRTMMKNHQDETLLKSITTGNGVKETITYKQAMQSISDNINIYSSNSNVENYPNIDLNAIPSLMVVSKLEKQSANSYKKKLFAYYGAVSNIDGLGFLGFRATMRTDWFDNTTASTEIFSNITKSDIALRGRVIETIKIKGLQEPTYQYSIYSPFITKSIYNYITPTEAMLPNKVFKLKLNWDQQSDELKKTNRLTSYIYDEYNNVSFSRAVTSKNNTNEKIYDTTIEYDNFPNGGQTSSSKYIVGREKNKTITTTINPYLTNQDITVSEEVYSYSSSNLLTQIKTKTTNSGITTNDITQNNTYDQFKGNLTKKKITAVGMTPRETNYEYSAAYGYRFLTKSIDVDGLATTYTYNNSTGNLLTETLPSNNNFPLTTTYTYDVWGKKTNTQNFLGNNQTVEYLRQNEKTLVTTTTVATDGNSVSTELLDDLGRKIQSGAKTLNGDMSYVDYEYDNYNRPTRISEPYIGTAPFLWNQTSYDGYSRVNQTITATGKTTTISYAGLTTTVNDGTKTKETVKNALGNVVSLTETPGGTVTYEYFANGNLKSSTADGATTTITQDGWGRKKELNDPAAGIYKYTYNDLGEITKEENPNGFTEYTYTTTGKLLTKWIKNAEPATTTNIKSTYAYDPTTKMLSIISVENPNDGNNTFSYTYDNYRRLTGTSEEYTTIQPRTFSKTLTFDDYGRIATETVTASAFNKSTTKTTLNTYSNGFLNKIYDGTAVTGTPLWQLSSQNARGQVKTELYGNSIAASQTYDDYGFPVTTSHSMLVNGSKVNIMQLTNTFDVPKGNLTNRTNNLFAWNESFDYDTADRLTMYNNNLGQSITQDYFDSGKIQTNSLGTYNYTAAANPYKNTSLSDLTIEGQTFANRNQIVTYNAFNSPIDITQSNERVSFGYNALQQRSVMYYGNNVVDKFNRSLRKYYSADGSIEIKYTKATTTLPEKVEFFTYIGGDAYSAPLVVRKIDNGIYENFYLHRDHLGSILAITNSTGTIVEKRLFDAWGKILNIQNGSGVTLTRFAFFDRGYTGHEHLQGVALINMNGRVYDPQLHRFLQPDNNVQDPFNTQNFNRYGYVLNNPLKYTDESGEFWGTLFSFLGQAIISSYVHTAQATGEGNVFKWDAQTWQSFGMNTASSTASYAATNYANSYIDHYNDKPEVTEPTRLDGVIDSVNPVKMVEGMVQGELDFYDSASNIVSGNSSYEDYLALVDKLLPGSQGARGLVELGYQAFEGDEYSQGVLIGQAVVIIVTKKAGSLKKIPTFETTTNVLSKGELLRIQNAATRINKPITVVGSRARGTAGAFSDWDYVIEGLNSKNWNKIKNSLPGSRSVLDNTPRNIDIFDGPVNTTLPHIIIFPRL